MINTRYLSHIHDYFAAKYEKKKKNPYSCQTHHVIPHGSGHVSMSLFTEVETVHREVGGVRFAILEKNNTESVGVFPEITC